MRARMRLTAEKTNSTPLPFITFEILQTFKNENVKANCTEKKNLIKGVTYTVNVNSWPCPHGPSLVMLLSHMTYSWMKRPDPDPRPSPTPHPPCLPCQRKTKPQTSRTPKINTATAQPSLRLREDREGTARGGSVLWCGYSTQPCQKKDDGQQKSRHSNGRQPSGKGNNAALHSCFFPSFWQPSYKHFAPQVANNTLTCHSKRTCGWLTSTTVGQFSVRLSEFSLYRQPHLSISCAFFFFFYKNLHHKSLFQ